VIAVFALKLDPEIIAAGQHCGDCRAPGAGKRVENEIAGAGERLYERRDDADRFLGRMPKEMLFIL
jgi:hypothetical protein